MLIEKKDPILILSPSAKHSFVSEQPEVIENCIQSYGSFLNKDSAKNYVEFLRSKNSNNRVELLERKSLEIFNSCVALYIEQIIKNNSLNKVIEDYIETFKILPLYMEVNTYKFNYLSFGAVTNIYVRSINAILSYCLATKTKHIHNLNELEPYFYDPEHYLSLKNIDPILQFTKYGQTEKLVSIDKIEHAQNLLTKKRHSDLINPLKFSIEGKYASLSKLLLILRLFNLKKNDFSQTDLLDIITKKISKDLYTHLKYAGFEYTSHVSTSKSQFSKVTNYIFEN